MCLAIPALVKTIKGEQAEVDIEGVTRDVSLQLTPEAKVGDYVLLHTGYAISVIDAAEAEETLSILREIADGDLFTVGYVDRPLVRFNDAGNHLEQCGFPRPVVADEANPAAVGNGPVDGVENLSVGKGKAYIFYKNQCFSNLLKKLQRRTSV